jgi:putative ABC transport system permease protein
VILVWLRGILARFPGRLAGAAAGVALTVALCGALGAQIVASSASMTRQAIANVGVDWQVQLNPSAAERDVRAAIARATRVDTLQPVWFADVGGFESTANGTVQTTGTGKVVGLPASYFTAFPGEVQVSIGAPRGVLLFSQTASNLHATIGSTVVLKRVGLPPANVRVDGIVSMPNADTFFQAVGLPPGTAPQAPPDNLVLLPAAQWHALFDGQRTVRPDSVREQLHVRIAHDALPADPRAAYDDVSGKAKNVEARIAGSGAIGDNLAARLLGAQADALYARVLFLFLGVPGAVLAALLTFTVAASGAARRADERALLRVRGASTRQIVALGAVEAIVVGVAGTVAGILLTVALVPNALAAHRTLLAVTACGGVLLALAAVLIPAWRDAHANTVAQSRAAIGRAGAPFWERAFVDVILLAIAGVTFWSTASTGYQVVLAPEGVPQATVHYEAFLAPVLLWFGAALLAVRVWRLVLLRGRGLLARLLRGISGTLATLVAASLARQHRLVTRATLLAGLAFAFGVSTAVFNSTYAAQSRVDAELTNGADVTVTGTTDAPPSRKLAELGTLPGVAAAAPMQHRYAFVGNDLQDLYGIDPRTIGDATPMSNAFFGGGNAAATLAELARTPDGVLVSEETVQTYQLHAGDTVMLRLQHAGSHAYVPVKFRFIGVTREFPTAPHDSFLVVNASYVAAQTGTGAAEIVLLRAQRPGAIDDIAREVRRVARDLPGARVTTIVETQRKIGSSLTAVDLRALTALELVFAIVFVAAATGLMLALGLAERLRTFAVLAALGAKSRQLLAFLAAEAAVVVVAGAAFGIVLGFAIAQVLVKVLTGVFDPPPEALVIPWPYIGGLVAAAAASTVLAVAITARATRASVIGALREL